MPLLRKRYDEVIKGIENLVNAIQMGIITPSTKQRIEELEKEKSQLSVEIMKEELARPTITRENILCFIEHFRKLNTNKLEHRRRLIDSFVNAIFLYDDKMVITFNYKEQSKTITFADLEESGLGSDNTALAAPKAQTIRQDGLCFSSFMQDLKDERYRATLRGSVVTASDQAPAGERVKSCQVHHTV